MALVHRASGFSGTLVRIEGGGRRAPGPHRPGAGLPPDPRGLRRRRPGREPGAGAGARTGRLPAGHRLGLGGGGRCPGPGGPGRPPVGRGHPRRRARRAGAGATTCASRASSSSGSTGSTTWPGPSPSSARDRPADSASWSTTWWPAARSPASPTGLRQPDVLITGTPFVDVWQAVRPSVLGIGAWPHIPRGIEWKVGVCADARLRATRRPPGGGSWRRCRPMPTSSRRWWAPSSGSSTSSPRPTERAT